MASASWRGSWWRVAPVIRAWGGMIGVQPVLPRLGRFPVTPGAAGTGPACRPSKAPELALAPTLVPTGLAIHIADPGTAR